MRPAALMVVSLTLILTLAAATPTKAETLSPLTCRDWQRMPVEGQTAYVRGVIEGIGLTTVTTAVALLPQAPLERQMALAQRLASSLVVDQRVGTYVSEMTVICRDPVLPPDVPLGFVFLGATEALRAREFSSNGWSGLDLRPAR